MKVRASVKKEVKDDIIVRRKGKVYVINKKIEDITKDKVNKEELWQE